MGAAAAAGVRTAGYSAWEECARRGGRNTRVGYRRQLAKIEYWVQGTSPQACARARLSYTFLKRHQVPELCEAGAPVGAKEVYSAPASPPHKRGMHPVRHLKSLKNVQLTTQLC